jgi:NADH-quinone oxidoreductase subunit C
MGKKDEIAQKLKALLPEDALQLDTLYRKGVAVSARVETGKLREAVTACDQVGYYLDAITGLDFEDGQELVYHFNCYEPLSRVAIRVLLGEGQTPPTISDIFPAALWNEREVHDFFGVEFEGSPDMRPLLLPEDADYHPLKKSFGKVSAYHKREVIYG